MTTDQASIFRAIVARCRRARERRDQLMSLLIDAYRVAKTTEEDALVRTLFVACGFPDPVTYARSS